MRNYTKRTKSTKVKTYEDYLAFRAEEEDKGYILKDAMSKKSFEELYKRLRKAKRQGEIKSQPWAELKRRERFVSKATVKNFAKAATLKYKHKVTLQDVYRMSREEIKEIVDYLNETKETGLYGGSYE